MTPEQVVQATYFSRFVAVLIGIGILLRCVYALRYETELRRRLLANIIIAGVSHFILFYTFTLVDFFQPLDAVPVIGLLATPAGQAMWGSGNGILISLTLFLIVDMNATVLRLRLNGKGEH